MSNFEALREVIRGIRNAKSEARVESRKVAAILVVKPEVKTFFEQEAETVIRLAGVDPQKLTITSSLEMPPARAVALVTGSATVYLPLAGLLDLEAEKARAGKELEETRLEAEKVGKTLSNSNFTSRAPEAVVAKERDRLKGFQEKIVKLEQRLLDLRPDEN